MGRDVLKSWDCAVRALSSGRCDRVQQGRIGLEKVGSQVVIPYALFQDHAWLQVVALFKSRVCGPPLHRASATVRTPPPQCAQSNRVSTNSYVLVDIV